jgi:hypothetical protein
MDRPYTFKEKLKFIWGETDRKIIKQNLSGSKRNRKHINSLSSYHDSSPSPEHNPRSQSMLISVDTKGNSDF